jgi:hypothetical protein
MDTNHKRQCIEDTVTLSRETYLLLLEHQRSTHDFMTALAAAGLADAAATDAAPVMQVAIPATVSLDVPHFEVVQCDMYLVKKYTRNEWKGYRMNVVLMNGHRWFDTMLLFACPDWSQMSLAIRSTAQVTNEIEKKVFRRKTAMHYALRNCHVGNNSKDITLCDVEHPFWDWAMSFTRPVPKEPIITPM